MLTSTNRGVKTECGSWKYFWGVTNSNLLKEFGCLLRSLFIAKLKAYSFDNNLLNLVNDYLSHHFQRTKIGNEYSSWKEIILGVLQRSILGPLFFNTHLCDLFFIIENLILPTLQVTIYHTSQEEMFLPLLNILRK